ncbi:hypothetical protein [uncultured Desulfosarcina sp.]|uniref:hypothetical protein n=1 Tax=uncultured Desulfosarcina sp. TaxID=218289 RepID=UPI0029C8A0EA|nr:hypothetical protein [uncultured Desulfosarcina sp.]
MFILIAACSGSYGHLVRSNAVGNLFERHEVLPDHRYFLTGPQSRPNAILAVHRSYTLQPGLWRPVEMTPELLKGLVDAMTGQLGFTPTIMGASVTNPEGKQIGVWYSPYSQTAIRFEPDNVVVVSLPSKDSDPLILERGKRPARRF